MGGEFLNEVGPVDAAALGVGLHDFTGVLDAEFFVPGDRVVFVW